MRSLFVATLASVMMVFASPPSLAQGRDLPDFADLVERVGPAVVNIRTTEKLRGAAAAEGLDDDDVQELFRRFFGVPAPQAPGQDKAPTPRGRSARPPARRNPDEPARSRRG